MQVVYPTEIKPSPAYGFGSFILDRGARTLTYSIAYRGLEGVPGTSYGFETYSSIRGPAPRGLNSEAILLDLPKSPYKQGIWNYAEGCGSPAEVASLENDILAGLLYVQVHSGLFSDFHAHGELRGQIEIDTDVDGLTDYEENAYFGTNPLDRDSDDDGLLDGVEVRGTGKLSHLPGPFGLAEYLAHMSMPGLSEGDAAASLDMGAFVTNPLSWDTDEDGLADGLEVGVTSGIPAVNWPGLQLSGTYGDANGDGVNDGLGYRYVDLAPDEPRTDPRWADTNGNEHLDGDDDENRNGRLDADETDPVKGFYYRSPYSPTNDAELVLPYNRNFPGDVPGFYEEYYFNFGSTTEDVTLTIDDQDDTVILPSSALSRAEGQIVPVSLFMPKTAEGTPGRSIRVTQSGGEMMLLDEGTPSSEELAKLYPTNLSAPPFSVWVHNNLRNQPPANYRADCDDFCKMAIWRYLSENDTLHTGLNTAKRKQKNPKGWKSGWVNINCYTKEQVASHVGPGNHFILHPGAIDIDNDSVDFDQNANTLCYKWGLTIITDDVITGGSVGSPDRRVLWERLIPGDMVFVNYHNNDIYGQVKPDKMKWVGVNERLPKIDHVFMLTQQSVGGLPRMFGQGGYWTVKVGGKLDFDDLTGGPFTRPNQNNPYPYLFEPHWIPLDNSYAGIIVPRDFLHVTSYFRTSTKEQNLGLTIDPSDPLSFRNYHLMNSLNDHFMIECTNGTQGDVGAGSDVILTGQRNIENFVREVLRFTEK